MNDLIVSAESPSAASCAEGLRILGPGFVALNDVESRGWLIGLAMPGVITDVADFIVDPIASLVGSAASFLMEYVKPAHIYLDRLAGDAAGVTAQAQTWSAVADRVTQTTADYRVRAESSLVGWSGPAATGYRSFINSYTSLLDGTGSLCAGIGSAMAGAAAIVGFVRTIVRETLADLVGKLISWASQVVMTAGAGATWVVPRACETIAKYVEKIRKWVTDLTTSVNNLAKSVQFLNKSLDDVTPVLGRLRQSVDVPMFSPQTTRTLNRVAPRASDFIPSGFTGAFTAGYGGADTYVDATT